MKEFNPDSYCGIYCGACSIAMRGETGRADALAACLGNLPREEFACGGCKSDTVYAGCATCPLRRCAREKGVGHCVDCASYPCEPYRRWQSVAKFLPHSGEAAASLEAIRRDGADPWLASRKKRWSCPACGSPYSWYAPECGHCGRNLKSEAHELYGWRKLLCRIVLPLAYRKGKAQPRT